jgi:hypothetical protein
MGVAGERLSDAGARFFKQETDTQDFLMTNGPITPASNSALFAEFGHRQANLAEQGGAGFSLLPAAKAAFQLFHFLEDNPRIASSLVFGVSRGTLNHDSVIGDQFWTGGAIALGVEDPTDPRSPAREAIKVTAVAGTWTPAAGGTPGTGTCTPIHDAHQNPADFTAPGLETGGDPNYLSTGKPRGVKTFLATQDVCIDVRIQFQSHDPTAVARQLQPIEDTSVEWRDGANGIFGTAPKGAPISPFVSVATVVVPKQDATLAEAECNALSWNPWHGLAHHRPLGNIMRARKEILAASAALRGASIERR